MPIIQFVNQITPETEEIMRKDLISYEHSHGIAINYQRFSLILLEKNKTIGVLNAYTAFAEIYIDDLWVHSDHCGKGYGRQLVAALENHFKDKGFNNINLVTSQFQAPDFYKKCGFEVEFVRKNIQNPKLTKFFFIKYFKDKIQTQGIFSNLNHEL